MRRFITDGKEIAQVFCTSAFFSPLLMSVSSSLGAGAFLGPMGRGVRWFCGLFFMRNPCFYYFFLWGSEVFAHPTASKLGHYFLLSLCSHFWALIWQRCLTAQFGSCGVKTLRANLRFVCIIFWCRSFFVSSLLVALSIMSGNLKNYVENVSLFIRMTSFLGWGTLLFKNWLLAQLDKQNECLCVKDRKSVV